MAVYRPRCMVIFPHLQNLEWHGSSTYEMPGISFFFVPTLRSVDIALVTDSPENMAGLSLTKALLVPLLSLVELRLPLRRLGIPIPHTETAMEESYHAACACLITYGQHLTEVIIVPSPALMQALGILPNLQSLTLHIRDWIESHTDLGITKASEAIFPVLDTLRLLDAPSPSQVKTLLIGTHCFARRHIEVHCNEYFDTTSEVSSLLKVVLHPRHYRTLQDFRLNITSRTLHWVQPANIVVQRNDIIGLLSCSNLRYFAFKSCDVSFTDAILEDMISAWRYISVLDLGVSFWPERLSSQVFGRLSACSHLRVVEIPFDVADEDMDDPPSPMAESPLQDLYVSDSHINLSQVFPFACFLARRFPEVRITSEDGTLSSEWSEVNRALNSARRLIASERLGPCRHV
ncbi:hypothetical protein K439DRAFT_912582 [Ramaria rubella]|nr:hypothetical protein K439DRAFT_912582 [Ramaria rubella]